MSILGRLRGEEPGLFKRIAVGMTEGTGGLGEYMTEYALEHGKLPGHVSVFRNLLVPRSTGPTSESEVDVLLLHDTGVYVMESKNYSGWIFGGEGQRQWTQTFENGTKERFYNPIIQNRAHVRALSAHLSLPEGVFRSYIVFSERCELKKVPEDGDAFVICKRPRMLKKLRADIAGRDALFDANQYDSLCTQIRALATASTAEAKAEHVAQAQRVNAGEVCPRCGSELVRRNGRYGEFIGCSSYPRCHYTRNL